MIKKTITVLMSISMLIAFIPTYAFAAEVPTTEATQTVEQPIDNPPNEEIQQDEQGTQEKQDDPKITNDGNVQEQPILSKKSVETSTRMTKSAAATTVKLTHIWPVYDSYGLSCRWGNHSDCGVSSHMNPGHYGIDIVAPAGKYVYASAKGKIYKATKSSVGYGYHIVIKHSDGTYSLYAHMSKFASGMKAGKEVAQGQIIGYVGSTGHSTGAHLHYGLYKSSTCFNNQNAYTVEASTFNPEKYLKKWLQVSVKTNTTTGKPVINWSKYPGTYKYRVYYKRINASSYTLLKTVSSSTFSLTHTSAKATFGYYYKVNAINSKNKTLRTSSAEYCTCKLAKPTLTKISKTSSNNVKVSFTGVTNANSYKLYRATSASGTYDYLLRINLKKTDRGGEGHYFISSGGTKGTKYYYKVRACHTKWTSADSYLSGYRYIVR